MKTPEVGSKVAIFFLSCILFFSLMPRLGHAAPGDMVTVAGGGIGDNSRAIAASLLHPSGVAVDAAGNLYIADTGNHRIRMIAAGTGNISTIAGNGTAAYSGDNGVATAAALNNPSAVAVDGPGNIYIADRGNNRIRKVIAESGIILTVAGNGTAGYAGDDAAATAASLNAPSGVAVDGAGNLYIADRNNNRIRKVAAETGIITTVAGKGTAGYAGDYGAATAAALNHPVAVAVDGARNLYVADESNHRIRKISSWRGIMTTVAGNGTAGYAGDNGAATAAALHTPAGVAVDGAGNLYIADQYNLRVRKVVPATGIITTLAGNGKSALAGDDGAATAASLAYPSGLATDSAGNIYIADTGNDSVRMVAADAVSEVAATTDTAAKSSTIANAAATTAVPLAAAAATAPPTYIYDSFTSSSTVAVETHVGETGSTWKLAGGFGPAYLDPATGGMYSSTDVTYGNTGTIPTADYSVIATIHAFSTIAGNQGVNGRLGSPVPSRYFAIFTQGLGWGLYAADGFGHENRIGALYGPTSLTAGRDYTVELRMIGSTISMYVDGVLAASGTNTMSSAAGRAGFESSGAGPGVGREMLDFRVVGISSGTSYTLTYSAGPNGTISGSASQTVASGGSGTQVTAVPNTGYQFVSWSDGVTTASRTDSNVTADLSVTANFAIATSYTLTYSAGANGTISGSASQTVSPGGSGTQVTAVPNAGYQFVSWSDGVTTASRTDSNVAANISVTAGFAAIATTTYTLSYSAGPNGTISGSTMQAVSSGGSGSQVTAVPNAGYLFVSWSDGVTTASRTDSNVTGNIAVTASFAAVAPGTTYIYDSFTSSSIVTLESHTGETGSSWKRVGGSASAYIDPATGAAYSNASLTYGNTGTIPSADYTVTATIHAYSSVGGTSQGVCGRLGSNVPSRYFAVFTQGLGWGLYAADGFGHLTRIGALYGAGSLTAGRDYVVQLKMVGSTISMYVDGVLAASGTDTMSSAAGLAGIEISGAGPGAAMTMLDFRVAPVAATNSYTLTYSAGANGTISGSASQTVASGGSGTQVTAVANSGYQFVSWSDGVTTASRTDSNVTGDLSVTASFAAVSYTLTYSAGANGTISGSASQTVASGGSGTQVTAVPNTGYQFVSWSDGVTTASRTDSNVTASISVTASFGAAASSYTLTYTAGPNGTISGSASQTVNGGGSGTLVTAVPNAGYQFVSWSDGVTTASRTDTAVTANISVTASFAAVSYTLTYSAGPNGTISGNAAQTVSAGGSGTQVTALPNAGYRFVSWSDGVTTASRTDSKVTGNISVTASFASITYTLTYSAGPNGTISGSTLQAVNSGGSGSQVTAVPDAGYQFVSWSDGVTTASRTDSNVTGNIAVTASFAPVTGQGTAYIYDSFTSSSTVNLQAHSGETGSSWKRVSGSGSAYIDPATGAAYSSTSLTYGNTGTIPSADYTVTATIHAYSSVDGTRQGVCGRLGAKIPSRYLAVFTQGVGWGLYAADGRGRSTRIGAVYGPRSLTAGRDYIVQLKMVASTISMYVDGVLAASGTDTTSTAAGRAGIEISGAGPRSAMTTLDFQVAPASPTTSP